jgi:DNA-binding PadR family transcriptional regulator
MTGLRGIKPITSSTFYILLALVDEPRHGLGIAAEIERRTDGDVRMGPGTLYNGIKKMLDNNLIQARSRKRMTPAGATTASQRRAGLPSRRKRLSSND